MTDSEVRELIIYCGSEPKDPYDEKIVEMAQDYLRLKARLAEIMQRNRWAEYSFHGGSLRPKLTTEEFVELCELAGIAAKEPSCPNQ